MEILQISRDAGYPIPSYQYIGFGGIKFVDFLLMNRYVGFKAYFSVEQSTDIIRRCQYNKPFGHIKLIHGSVSDFILSRHLNKKSVLWLDYDSPITADVAEDIASCGAKLKSQSFVFFTINAEPTRSFRGMKPSARREFFLKNFKDKAASFVDADFETSSFPSTVARTVFRLALNAFSGRGSIEFIPLVFSLYRDSSWMCTVGGLIDDPLLPRAKKLITLLNDRLPEFTVDRSKESYVVVPQTNITEIERQLLDTVVTQNRKKSKERKMAMSLGFTDEYLQQYRSVLRFIPRYIEAAT